MEALQLHVADLVDLLPFKLPQCNLFQSKTNSFLTET